MDKAKKTAELEKTILELTNNWKRALADYQNLEKRISEEQSERAKWAAKNIILKLLPAVDIVEKAALYTKDQGVKLAAKALLSALYDEGLTRIEAVGKTFDPHLMECVDVVTGEEENKVIEEIRPGYLLHGTVIRPVQVKVTKIQN